YLCKVVTTSFVDATTVLPLSGDDAALNVALPFPFPFYGQTYTSANVSTNGFLSFVAPDWTYTNRPIPDVSPPNGAIYPFWDDLYVDGAASVRTEVVGVAPNRQFLVEWRDVTFFDDRSRRVRFQVALSEGGTIQTRY